MNKRKRFLNENNREFSLILALIAMVIVFTLINPLYIQVSNLRDIIDQASIYGFMGLGMTFVIISGGIDLSVGSVLAALGVIVAKMAVAGIHPVLIIIATIIIAMVIGSVNGILITKLKLQPFIVTMGTMMIFRGLAYIISDGLPVTGVPDSFRKVVDGVVFANIRVSIFMFIGLTIIFHILLKNTKFGCHVFAIGGNVESARLSGINVDLNLIMIYAVGMVGTALAALVQIGKLGTGEPSAGQGYEMNAIAAVAIGGCSMAGGRGGMIGTMIGAILFAGLKIGLIVSGTETFYQYVATGLVIIFAAAVELIQSKLKIKKNK